MSTERRFLSATEVSATSHGGEKRIGGYALKFNRMSSWLSSGNSRFRERIAPTALRSEEKRGFKGVVALWNHDPLYPLARVGEGLTLKADETGLRYDVILGNTTYANDLYDNVQRGVVRGSSFGFSLDSAGGDDAWDIENPKDFADQMDEEDEIDDEEGNKSADRGVVVRTIKNLRLADVSPVTYPAYSSSTVSVRSQNTIVLAAPPLDLQQKQYEANWRKELFDKPGLLQEQARSRRKDLLRSLLS